MIPMRHILALKSRYEKQAKELEKKMNHLKCEGR